jgi:hypothetical protein
MQWAFEANMDLSRYRSLCTCLAVIGCLCFSPAAEAKGRGEASAMRQLAQCQVSLSAFLVQMPYFQSLDFDKVADMVAVNTSSFADVTIDHAAIARKYRQSRERTSHILNKMLCATMRYIYEAEFDDAVPALKDAFARPDLSQSEREALISENIKRVSQSVAQQWCGENSPYRRYCR